MLKILSSVQIQEADKFTIVNEPISSIDLMERAASKCFNYLIENIPSGISFAIFCGSGNNGGDGLALARMLFNYGKIVHLFLIESKGEKSEDYRNNFDRLPTDLKSTITYVSDKHHVFNFDSKTLIIDAIFGIGLNKPIEGFISKLIKHLNNLPCKRIAIDIPSGLYVDQHTPDITNVFQANVTLTFQFPKQSFFYPEYGNAVGEFIILDIGINADYIKNAKTKFALIDKLDIDVLFKKRKPFSYKGTFGHALLLAGSKGKAGAAILCCNACLRIGAGLVTVQSGFINLIPLQVAVPEAMVNVDENENYITSYPKILEYDAIGIGPGIGTEKETANILKRIIQEYKNPIILDADALNILAANKTWLSFLPNGSILTPHIGEFNRLINDEVKKNHVKLNPFERTNAQIDLAKKTNCYVLLKGKYSSLACPDGSIYFNPTGNPGMATAGSGDVLTGILTGLIAQNYQPAQAAILGMYLHGLAGDYAAINLSMQSMKAGDIIDYLSLAIKEFES